MQTDLTALANTFNKDIFIAETAYPAGFGMEPINTNDIFGYWYCLIAGL
jgi:arabinogalactan endo-1,4-beta-galactosidase